MGFQVAALAGTAAISAGGQLMAGSAQARAQRSQAAQYEQMAQESKVQTLQEEVARRRKLIDMTGSNQLDVAARGVTSDSGSYEAIAAENQRQAELDISNQRFVGDARTRRYGLASHMANQAAQQARMQSYFGAASSIAGAAFRYGMGAGGSAPEPGSGASIGSMTGSMGYS
jgi:hypothetical protein